MTTHKNQEPQERWTFTWNCIERKESSQLPTVRLSPVALLLADLPFLAFSVSAPLGPLSLLWSTCLSLSSLLQSIFLVSLNRVSKPAYPSLEAMSLYSATGRIRKCSFSVQHTWPVKLLLFHPSVTSHSSDLMDCSSSVRGILQAGILEWAAIFFDWISDKLAV